MTGLPLTRRGFIAGCAGLGAAAACSGMAAQAFAEGGDIGANARPEWNTVHTICTACPNACGFTAYTVEGELGKTLGDTYNPNATGKLCARGYGYTQSVHSAAKVKNPMRRKANGEFQTISWDEAFAEISEQLLSIMQENGSESVSLIYDGTVPDARIYSSMLMNALDSGNAFVDDVTYDTIKASAFTQTIGSTSYYPDIDDSDLVLLIDTSLTDVTTPQLVAALQTARADAKRIVSVDPRLGTLGSFANDWLPVNPGTELALLLSVCQHLVSTGRYDKDFVNQNVSGFDAWAKAIAEYTPRWAESITGIESFRIEELASLLAEAAPKVAIQYGNGNIAGVAYNNSYSTARVVCLLNALLGTWGQTGGALLPFDYASSPILDAPLRCGAAETLQLCKRGLVNALITVDADVAYDYSSIPDLQKALEDLDLMVCISHEMTATAQCADYVLPLSSYLESTTLPQPIQGKMAAFAMASDVLEPKDGDNSMPIGPLMDSLAVALGSKEPPSAEAASQAEDRIRAYGITPEGLAQNGTEEVLRGKIDRISTWRTASEKIECMSASSEDATTELPLWIPPLGESNIIALTSDDMNDVQANVVTAVIEEDADEPVFHLITGQQSVLGMHGYNVPELMDIAEQYELDRAWMNRDVAELLGISNNDEIVLRNDVASCNAKAFVTDRIAPTAIYMPMSFGRSAERQKTAKGIGSNPLLFSDPIVDSVGALCTQEACVNMMVEKEGA